MRRRRLRAAGPAHGGPAGGDPPLHGDALTARDEHSHAELLEVLHRVSARCHELEAATAGQRLPQLLGLLGVHLRADEVWLYRIDHEVSNPVSWWRRGDGPVLHAAYAVAAFPTAARHLAELAPLAVRVGADPLTPEQQALSDLGMGASLVVPSGRRGVPTALLVVCHADPDHQWPAAWQLPLRIAADQIAHALLRLDAEARVARSEQRFRMFSDSSTEGICVHREGYIADVNDAVLRMTGNTREAVLGRHVLDFLHPDERVEAEARLRGDLPAMEVARIRRIDGSWLWCEIKSRQVVTEDGRVRLLAIRDISAQREAEQLLRESEERFRILGESTYDGIAVCDGQLIVQANPSFAAMFGYDPDEVVGLTPDDLHTAESVERLLDRTEGGGHDAVEVVGVRRDGSRFPVLVRGRWCRMDGRMVRISGYLDLTARDRAEAERRALEAQVRHAQKLESLGLLAGGIAHDFNNLLVGVLGNAELALMEPDLPPTIGTAVERIRGAARRASELTNQMLAYSGKGRFEIRAVDVNVRIREMTELLEVSLGKGVRLSMRLAPDLWPVEGDPAQMDQILMNLVTNASDAIGDRRGHIRVGTSCRELRGNGPPNVLDEPLPPGRYVVVEVADTGHGMDDEVRQRIFDPFYSTKFTGRGLGLAAVQGIVRGHEGAIEVDSAPGAGTTFRVWLPASAGGRAASSAPGRRFAAGRARILLADDEPAVRDVTRRMLERVGYEAESVADGAQAIDRLEANPAGFDVVLLDMTMPGPSGLETLARVRRIRADLPVVLCSGYAPPVRIDESAVTYLQKPFRLDDLVRAVQGALGRSP